MPLPRAGTRVVDLTQALLDVDATPAPLQRARDMPQRQRAAVSGKTEAVSAAASISAEELPQEEELTDDFFQAFSSTPRKVTCYTDGEAHVVESNEEEAAEDDNGPQSPRTQHSNRPQLTLVASPSPEADEDEDEERDDDNKSSSSGDDSEKEEGLASRERKRMRSSETSDGRSPPHVSPSPSPVAQVEESQPSAAAAVQQWPRPCPPAASAQPPRGQSRVTFHTQRYGAFVRAYCGLKTEEEVQQAQRRARSICVIGVSKQARGKGGLGCATKASRTFLRHSVLAVEGDAVFNELMERAEMLYGVELQRAHRTGDALLRAMSEREQEEEDVVVEEREEKEEEAGSGSGSGSADGERQRREFARGDVCPSKPHKKAAESITPQQLLKGVLMPSAAHHFPAKLPRVSDPFLRPNARCIALHYGLPASATYAAPASAAKEPPPYHQRVSLMAVISTTRIEDGEEIYVSLESYYRCLDEVAWHRQRYGSDSHSFHASASQAKEAVKGRDEERNPLVHGDVYTGVKQFKRWPNGLCYYHGVGRQHSGSDVAEAGFPFTLLDLTLAPELGEKELGVVAAEFVPYATCFLYTGPAIATQKVESLFFNNANGKGAGADGGSSNRNEQGNKDTVPPGRSPRQRGKRKARPKHQRDSNAGKNASRAASVQEEEIDFDMDDTYALGLGRHGVCFGQGVARYINHRYNTSRYGNVELCSVMLSVPSEFSSLKREEWDGAVRRHTRHGSASTADASRPSTRIGDAAEEQQGVLATRSGGGSSSAGDGRLAGKKRRAVPRRSRAIFLEEESHFITVPFFVTTTDIEAGSALLAWTYGEEYDAKLERVAVADGAVVPYADSALLNARPLMGEAAAQQQSPGDSLMAPAGVPVVRLTASPTAVPQQVPRRWQRYGGDYRFALGVGDVVWRRRPVTTASMRLASLNWSQLALFSPCQCGVCQALCPPPERDLFVVVQLMKDSAERALLLPLEQKHLSEAALHDLLESQHLTDYTSPFAPKEAVEVHTEAQAEEVDAEAEREEDEEDEISVILGAKLYSRTASGANSLAGSATATPIQQRRRRRSAAEERGQEKTNGQAAKSVAQATTRPRPLREEWAVFDTNLVSLLSFTSPHRLLRRCIVATTASLGLLLPDLDYVTVRSHKTAGSGGGSTGALSEGGGGGGGTAKQLVFNLDDLRHSTLLVRSSDRVCAVPPLPNGLLWPTIRRQAGGLGSDWMYATEKRKELRQ